MVTAIFNNRKHNEIEYRYRYIIYFFKVLMIEILEKVKFRCSVSLCVIIIILEGNNTTMLSS